MNSVTLLKRTFTPILGCRFCLAAFQLPTFQPPPSLSTTLHQQRRPSSIKSSADWARRQNKDIYVREARLNNYRSRASFKLAQIQKKHRLLKQGMVVLDLGASPGGWSQVAGELVWDEEIKEGSRRKNGLVIAIDLVPLRPVFEPPGCRFIQGDITSPQTMDQIRDILQARNTKVAREKLKVDAVISDMAPHSSGIEITDRTRQIELCYAALGVARKMLKVGGTFVCKVFVGGEETKLRHKLLDYFYSVQVMRPPATRKTSSEVYFICQNNFMGEEADQGNSESDRPSTWTQAAEDDDGYASAFEIDWPKKVAVNGKTRDAQQEDTTVGPPNKSGQVAEDEEEDKDEDDD